MRIGTRSLLFGCHQLIIHPIFTAIAWVQLYGWCSFGWKSALVIFFHDWGYWGCRDMDGPDGSLHPIRLPRVLLRILYRILLDEMMNEIFCHSRHLCSKNGWEPSRLCWADKLGTALMPSWLWAVLAYASREGWEYMSNLYGNDYVKGEEHTLRGLIKFHQSYKTQYDWRNM